MGRRRRERRSSQVPFDAADDSAAAFEYAGVRRNPTASIHEAHRQAERRRPLGVLARSIHHRLGLRLLHERVSLSLADRDGRPPRPAPPSFQTAAFLFRPHEEESLMDRAAVTLGSNFRCLDSAEYEGVFAGCPPRCLSVLSQAASASGGLNDANAALLLQREAVELVLKGDLSPAGLEDLVRRVEGQQNDAEVAEDWENMASLPAVRHVVGCANLVSLHLDSPNLTVDFVARAVVAMPRLERLSILNCMEDFSDELETDMIPTNLLAALSGLPRLRRLDISCCLWLTNEFILALAAAFVESRGQVGLTHLRCKATRATSSVLQRIAKLVTDVVPTLQFHGEVVGDAEFRFHELGQWAEQGTLAAFGGATRVGGQGARGSLEMAGWSAEDADRSMETVSTLEDGSVMVPLMTGSGREASLSPHARAEAGFDGEAFDGVSFGDFFDHLGVMPSNRLV